VKRHKVVTSEALNSPNQSVGSMKEKRFYNFFLKRFSEMSGECWSAGRLFHASGPLTENARMVSMVVLVRGT